MVDRDRSAKQEETVQRYLSGVSGVRGVSGISGVNISCRRSKTVERRHTRKVVERGRDGRGRKVGPRATEDEMGEGDSSEVAGLSNQTSRSHFRSHSDSPL